MNDDILWLTTEVFEKDKGKESLVLKPNGQPFVLYPRTKLGFKLEPKEK